MSRKTHIMLVTGLAILIFANGCVWLAWEAAKSKDTLEGYQGFFREHPRGGRAEQAQWKIAERKGTIEGYEEYLQNVSVHSSSGEIIFDGKFAAQARWRIAQQKGTIEAFNHYVEKHPEGEYAEQTRMLLNDWKNARSADTIEAYEVFLKEHPQG